MRNPFHSFVLLAAMSCTLSFAQNTDHSVKRDVTKTQMSVKTTDNSVRYYNIDALNKVSFEDDKTIAEMSEYILNKYETGERSWSAIAERYINFYNSII